MKKLKRQFAGLLAALGCLVVFTNPVFAAPAYKLVRFDQLLGWETDDHSKALEAFTKTCSNIAAVEWSPICKFAATKPNAKAFFETFFIPVEIQPDSKAKFTGYYEPDLKGSLTRKGPYKYPIYSKPKSFSPGDPKLTRAAIDDGALKNKGLVIAYVKDPVEAYYLHIQGSGRINLTNGKTIRVGYADENGHVYRSAASEMVRLGYITQQAASIAGIKAWVKRNPVLGLKALQHNASYVFFKKRNVDDKKSGPRGALNRPITAKRTLAVDRRFVQLGAPVWIEKGGYNQMRQLMIAQDVGSAIKGPQRADIFFGTGHAAGKLAGQTNDGGRMVVLLPTIIAHRLVPQKTKP